MAWYFAHRKHHGVVDHGEGGSGECLEEIERKLVWHRDWMVRLLDGEARVQGLIAREKGRTHASVSVGCVVRTMHWHMHVSMCCL